MRTTLLTIAGLAALTVLAPAQLPVYTAEVLGPGVVINDMNEHGQVVGWSLPAGLGVQAFLVGPGGQQEILPLPSGYQSGWAQGVNDAGVVVGSVATGGFPEFGEPVAWTPDGEGGYEVAFLTLIPGYTQGVAYDVNNRGDVVGVSITPGWQGGPTTWFNAPGGPVNLSALGAPTSPKEVSDQGVFVGLTGGLFDLDTLTAIPLKPFTGNFNNFQAWAVNEHGEVAGKGFHGSLRSAASWTQAHGWTSHSQLVDSSASVQAFDINADGVVVLELPPPAVAYPGLGTHTLASRVAPQSGSWSFFVSLGAAINDAGQIAAMGNGPSGMGGVVLLTPVEEDPFADLGGGLAGAVGVPPLTGQGTVSAGGTVTLTLTDALPSTTTALVLGLTVLGAPFKGGTLVPMPDAYLLGLTVDAAGEHALIETWPAVPTGTQVVLQHWITDPAGPKGFAASNGLAITQP
jgi:hypothetical protein